MTPALAAFWLGWREYVVHRFAANASESLSRVWLNAGILLLPLTWPQLLGACGYLWLLVWILRNRIPDPTLRAWAWIMPVWFGFMFYYGIFIETRIFGEMIPYLACVAGLLCEERLLGLIVRRDAPVFSEDPAAEAAGGQEPFSAFSPRLGRCDALNAGEPDVAELLR